MESLVDGMKAMVKVFRRECHKVLNSERTTIHGADGMLMVLQLAMADVNKKVTNYFVIDTPLVVTHNKTLCPRNINLYVSKWREKVFLSS